MYHADLVAMVRLGEQVAPLVDEAGGVPQFKKEAKLGHQLSSLVDKAGGVPDLQAKVRLADQLASLVEEAGGVPELRAKVRLADQFAPVAAKRPAEQDMHGRLKRMPTSAGRSREGQLSAAVMPTLQPPSPFLTSEGRGSSRDRRPTHDHVSGGHQKPNADSSQPAQGLTRYPAAFWFPDEGQGSHLVLPGEKAMSNDLADFLLEGLSANINEKNKKDWERMVPMDDRCILLHLKAKLGMSGFTDDGDGACETCSGLRNAARGRKAAIRPCARLNVLATRS
jgi:hypothetical protein